MHVPDFISRTHFMIKKELLLLLKSPKMRFTIFLPPLIQLLVLGYAATMDLKEIDFAVLDHSKSASSRELISKFTGGGVFQRKNDFISEKDMAERISERNVKMALVIPEDFERSLALGTPVDIQVIVDGRNSSSGGIALGYAESVVEKFNSTRNPTAHVPVRIESRAWYNPNYSAQYFMVPALLATIALLDLMLLSSLSLAREREDGTFDQLLLTPYSSFELLAGKAFSAVIVGTFQLTAGLLVALLWFRIPFEGSFVLLYAMFFTFMFASVGIGLLISVFSKNLNQAMMGVFLVAVPFAMLSGMATPIESMPEIFQDITLANPIRYGVKALQRLFLEGATFTDLAPSFGVLIVIGVVAFTCSYFVFQYQRRS